jgi:hypothetical protein
MVIVYNRDNSKTYSSTLIPDNFFSGTNVFNNSRGQVVLTESWTSTGTNTGTSTTTNATNIKKTYLDVSNIQIQNLPKFNGNYISNYTFNDDFINKTQKELVVYYIGVTNKCRIKVTYLDFFEKVIIRCGK